MLVKPPLAGVGTFKQLVRQPVQAARREPSMQDALPRPASREIPRAGNEWKRLRVPCRAVRPCQCRWPPAAARGKPRTRGRARGLPAAPSHRPPAAAARTTDGDDDALPAPPSTKAGSSIEYARTVRMHVRSRCTCTGQSPRRGAQVSVSSRRDSTKRTPSKAGRLACETERTYRASVPNSQRVV